MTPLRASLYKAFFALVLILSPSTGWSMDQSSSGSFSTKPFAVDAGLWIATYAMETYWTQPEGLRTFPTTSFDEFARNRLHGAELEEEYTPRERAWRKYSDLGIAGLVVGSLATPLVSDDSRWSKLSKVSRAFAINNFATIFLKNAVHRSRPKPSRLESVPQDGDNAKSFPSGHASNAMVAATSIVLLTPDKPVAFHAAVYGLAGSIAVARVLADRHHLTDILVGAALGYGVTRLTFQSENAEQRDQAKVLAGLSSVGLQFSF